MSLNVHGTEDQGMLKINWFVWCVTVYLKAKVFIVVKNSQARTHSSQGQDVIMGILNNLSAEVFIVSHWFEHTKVSKEKKMKRIAQERMPNC